MKHVSWNLAIDTIKTGSLRLITQSNLILNQKSFRLPFPKHITSEVLQEVIHNTCFECGGLMKDGVAFDNTWVSSNDFGNDAGQRGTTMSKVGPAKQIKVRKCIICGHSHT